MRAVSGLVGAVRPMGLGNQGKALRGLLSAGTHCSATSSSKSAPASPVAVGRALDGMYLARLLQAPANQLFSHTLDDPAAAGQLLFTPGLLYDAAKKDAAADKHAAANKDATANTTVFSRFFLGAVGNVDAKEERNELDAYLKLVSSCAGSFLHRTEHEDGLPQIVDHDATLAALRALGGDLGEGRLMLLTGPRSVGKSLMLQKLAAELKKLKRKRRVLIFDAREYGTDLVRGIMASLAADSQFNRALKKAASAWPGLERGEKAKALSDSVATRAELPIDVLLGAFVTSCKQKGEFPVLIIDEANQALATADHSLRKRTFELLQLLTRLTKQRGEASVVIATSEHGLASRLRSVGYNVDHITDTIVAGEVPGPAMEELLTKTWGCGPHLARMLLLMYGGHVLHASLAVSKLVTSPDRESMRGAAALGCMISAPARCFSESTLSAAGVPTEERQEVRERVRAALRAMVIDGFVPLDSEEDKVAEIISLANAGFVAPLSSVGGSIPPKAWEARTPNCESPTHVLMPSSHTMRLLIARKVFPPPQPAAAGPTVTSVL